VAIADVATYKALITSPAQVIPLSKNGPVTTIGRLMSFWLSATDAGVAPTTAVAPDKSTAGALAGFLNYGTQYVAQIEAASLGGRQHYLILVDRLSHQGGLSGTSTSAQTTNLPTAALTRYTDGVGVMAALEIYTQIGTTGVTFTASYTNQAGTSGQTSQAVGIGASNAREASRLFPFSLAAGDSGVQAVASVTLSLSTGTTGNFGVTLFKPLLAVPFIGGHGNLWDAVVGGMCNLPPIQADACLQWLCMSSDTAFQFAGKVSFIQE